MHLLFFPKITEKDYLFDSVDGLVHTLYYLDGKLIRVGKNDYIEFDIEDKYVRDLEPKLKKLVQQKGELMVNDWLWEQFGK